MLQKLGKQSLEFLGRSEISGAGPREIVRRGLGSVSACGRLILGLHNSLFISDEAGMVGSNYGGVFTAQDKKKYCQECATQPGRHEKMLVLYVSHAHLGNVAYRVGYS